MKPRHLVFCDYYAWWFEFTFIVDIDECGANIDGCSQICSNVNGSYDCDCHFGFSLNDDRKTCSKGKHMYIYCIFTHVLTHQTPLSIDQIFTSSNVFNLIQYKTHAFSSLDWTAVMGASRLNKTKRSDYVSVQRVTFSTSRTSHRA